MLSAIESKYKLTYYDYEPDPNPGFPFIIGLDIAGRENLGGIKWSVDDPAAFQVIGFGEQKLKWSQIIAIGFDGPSVDLTVPPPGGFNGKSPDYLLSWFCDFASKYGAKNVKNLKIDFSQITNQTWEKLLSLLKSRQDIEITSFGKNRAVGIPLAYRNDIFYHLAKNSLKALSKDSVKITLNKLYIDDKNIEKLITLLKDFSHLEELDLSDNEISYVGARRLAAALPFTKLKILDLSNNYIYCTRELFEKLGKNFARYPHLQIIKIGQNFIDKTCKPLFKQPPSSNMNSELHFYQFFQTQIVGISSLLKPYLKINCENWVVGLFCKKGTEHAMIYMERMRKNGQRTLERYHITAEGIIGIANVQIEDVHPKFFDSESFYKKIFEINNTNGSILKDLIKDEKTKQVNFSKFYPSSYKNKVNCLEWCLHKFKEIDIHIERSALGLPSNTARGEGCNIS